MTQQPDPDEELSRDQVAKMFGVCPDTVTRWAKNGKLESTLRTLGGHRRWRRGDCEAFLRQGGGG